MRPITVSVGPLAPAGAAGLIPTVTATGPGQLLMGSTNPSGGSATRAFNGNVTVVNGVLTVNTVTVGAIFAGMALSGTGYPPNCTVLAPAPGSIAGGGPGSTWIVYPTFSAAAAIARGNSLYTYDKPRQILFTTTEPPGNAITVWGFDAAGSPISETMPTTGASLTTQQNFAQVTQVAVAAATAGAVQGGTTTATSQWVNFDPWAGASISEQLDVVGTVNYTVQISNDDPNAPTNPTPPALMDWFPDPNAALVGASTSQFASWAFVPLYARILLNSGTGSVTGTFSQTGSVSR